MSAYRILRALTVLSLCAAVWGSSSVATASAPQTEPGAAGYFDEGPEGDSVAAPELPEAPQQDESANGPAQLGPLAVAPTLSFYSVPGTALQPTDSTHSYTYGSNGCLVSKSSQSYDVEMNLPDGALLNTIRIYWQNNGVTSTLASTAYIYVFTHTDTIASGVVSAKLGNYILASVIATSPSAQGTGYWTTYSTAGGIHYINNGPNSYVLRWTAPANSRQEMCAIRVSYYAPVTFNAYMPVVRK